MIELRFAQGTDFASELIIDRENICMPFIPSHVETVMPAWSKHPGAWAGQRAGTGMQPRPAYYDAPKTAHQLFLKLPSTDEQEHAFYDFVEGKFGAEYDWKAILDYALPMNLHIRDHAICSAIMHLALRAADWYPSHAPSAVPAHLIDPRDLLFGLSLIVLVPH